jgi:hypothetical protein
MLTQLLEISSIICVFITAIFNLRRLLLILIFNRFFHSPLPHQRTSVATLISEMLQRIWVKFGIQNI